MLRAEYERVSRGEPMQQIDVMRYRLDPPPPAKRNDIAAWKAALDNAHAQLEHQYNRCAGLDFCIHAHSSHWPSARRGDPCSAALLNGKLNCK